MERRGEDWKVWGKGVKRGEWQERMTGDSENANTRGGTEGNGHCKKRKVNKFDNVDVECTVFENGQEAFHFKPTNREWRIRKCLRFNLPGPPSSAREDSKPSCLPGACEPKASRSYCRRWQLPLPRN